MKRILSAAVLLAFALTVAGAASADDAAATFGVKCSACHGKDGKGETPMGKKMGVADLSQTKLSAADLEKAIGDGKPPKMQSFRGKLSDAEIKALAAWIKGGLK
jgi:cytochrome c6